MTERRLQQITRMLKRTHLTRKLLVVLTCLAVGVTTLGFLVGVGSVDIARADDTTITLSPEPAILNGCNTVEVQIWVNQVEDLYGVDVRIAFDPATLEVVDVLPDYGVNLQPGGFLENLWIVKNEANNVAGTIWFAATQLNPALPKDGSGVIATITFRAKDAGTPILNFTYSKLAEINGTEIPAVAVNGSVQINRPPAPTLSISRLNATDARLSWDVVGGAAKYFLYRGVTPYFTPTNPPYHTTTSLFYDDLGALGDVDVQHYYTVKSACGNDFSSSISNRVGEYDFALQSALAFNYNDISVVLENTSITDASSLAAYIGASVTRVMYFNPGTQTFFIHNVGTPIGNFSLTTGQFLFIVTNNTAPSSFALVGNVPDPEEVSFSLVSGSPAKFNYISLPLDQSSLTSASQVATNIGSSVYRVLRYRTDTQSYQIYTPGSPIGNFPLVIGEPFIVQLSPGAPSEWP